MKTDSLLSLTSLFLMMFAFAGVCWWAFAPRRKKRFEEDALLPFADDEPVQTDKQNDNDSSHNRDEVRQDK